MSQQTSAAPIRGLIEVAGRIQVFAAGLTRQAGNLPPSSEARQTLTAELDAARCEALGVGTEPFLSFSEWRGRVGALVSVCRAGLCFDPVDGDFAAWTQTLGQAIAAVDGVATRLEAGETLPNDHPAPSGDAEFLAALAGVDRELNEVQLTREREVAREQTYAQWRVRHERLSQLLFEVRNVSETAAEVEGFWELWAEKFADLGRLLNDLGLGNAIDAFSMEATDPRSAAARTVVVTAIRMACRGGRSDSIAPLFMRVRDQRLLPQVSFWVHHIAHHLLAAWSARWKEDPAAQESEAACSSADWRIVGDAPAEGVSRFPQPAGGRFVHVLPPPTRDGNAEVQGETRFIVPHPSLALCWGNGRGQEVIGRCDGYLVRTRPADAPWLPEGWRMEWCPIGWALPHIEHWFGHALRVAKRDNRPAVPDGAAVSPSAPPTPRELVAHAHLIVRHLNLPGSPPEPRGQMSRADCIAELEAVREFLRKALPSHPDTSSTELAARTDRQNRQVTPVQELLSSVEVQRRAAAEAERASQRLRRIEDAVRQVPHPPGCDPEESNRPELWTPDAWADRFLAAAESLKEEGIGSLPDLLGDREASAAHRAGVEMWRLALSGDRDGLLREVGEVQTDPTAYSIFSRALLDVNDRLLGAAARLPSAEPPPEVRAILDQARAVRERQEAEQRRREREETDRRRREVALNGFKEVLSQYWDYLDWTMRQWRSDPTPLFPRLRSTLAEVCRVFRESGREENWRRVDRERTFALYWSDHRDPQEANVAFAWACHLIGAGFRGELREEDIARGWEEPALRGSLTMVAVLLQEVNGDRRLEMRCDSPSEIGPGPADPPTIVGEGSVLNAPQPAQKDTAPHDAGRIDTAGGNAYVFRLSGDLWELRFGEESGFARDSEGLRRIAQLLARPDQSIGALELMGSDLSRLDTSRSYQDDLDQETLKSCRDELKAIEKQIEDAAALGNAEEAYRLAERREEIQKNLRRGEKPAGKGRRNLDSSSPREKARKAVGNSIRKAYKAIRKAGLPSLADYLEKRLQLGTDCSYYPSGPPLPWQL